MDEFEIIPVNPLRRLEKRIERLESFSTEDPKSIFKDIIEIVRMNQMIVDELAKSNDSLRVELSKLPGRLDELITDMKELITFIKMSGENEQPSFNPEIMKPVVEKLDALVNINKSFVEKNEEMMGLLDEVNRKLKRTTTISTFQSSTPVLPQQSPQPLQRPMPIRPMPKKSIGNI